jgi:sec-independent protein translocase protein TatB
MLFDLGWSEILVIGTVALVFIGPKDLPKALRVAGYWVRKARTLSREFQSSIDQMIREAELDEMRQDLKKAAEFDLDKEFRNTIDPTGSLSESLKPPELPNFSGSEPALTPTVGNGAEPAVTAPAETAAMHALAPAEAPVMRATPAEAPVMHATPGDPVPMVPAPESELDEIAEAERVAPNPPPCETGGHGIIPPKP